MVFGDVQDSCRLRVLAGAYVVDPAVADMCNGGSVPMQLQEYHGSTHFLYRAGVFGIEGIKSALDGIVEDFVRECRAGGLPDDCLGHRLAHSGTGHLPGVVPAHAVADDKQAVVFLQPAVCRKQAVFLMRVALGILALAVFQYIECRYFIFHSNTP